jgi:hypothetical protein
MARRLTADGFEAAPRFCVPSTGRWRRSAAGAAALILLVAPTALQAQSDNVRITDLSDVNFGTLGNLGVDAILAQNICVFANTTGRRYRVQAAGSAPGGAFALTSGASLLPYEVQWSASSGQSSGTQLTSGVARTGLVSAATQQACNSGPATSASLVILLRSTSLSSARAGSYSGTLTLVVGAD